MTYAQLDSRKFLREIPEIPHQENLFPEISLPPIIRWNWKLRNPLIGDWELPPKIAAECSAYFLRNWTRDWGMKVLKKAALECDGFFIHNGVSYKVIFGTSQKEFNWLECPERFTGIMFSFRAHPSGNFVVVQPRIKVK